jgi:hypothetical protein
LGCIECMREIVGLGDEVTRASRRHPPSVAR